LRCVQGEGWNIHIQENQVFIRFQQHCFSMRIFVHSALLVCTMLGLVFISGCLSHESPDSGTNSSVDQSVPLKITDSEDNATFEPNETELLTPEERFPSKNDSIIRYVPTITPTTQITEASPCSCNNTCKTLSCPPRLRCCPDYLKGPTCYNPKTAYYCVKVPSCNNCYILTQDYRYTSDISGNAWEWKPL